MNYYAPGQHPPYPPQRARKHRRWPWVIVAVAVVVGFGSCVASVSHGVHDAAQVIATSGVPSVSAAPPPQNHVGTTLSVNTGGGAQAAVTLTRAGTDGTPGPLGDGGEWSITVTIQATVGTVHVNPLYWAARTDDGTELSADLGSVGNELASTEVLAGQKVSGEVGFKVPAGKQVSTVLFEGPLGSQLAAWIVP